MSTMKLKDSSVKPSAKSKPGSTLWRLRSVREKSMSGLLSGAQDLVVGRAVVEVLLLRLAPAAEHLVDGEEIDLREVLRVLLQQGRRARAQLVLRRDLLCLIGPQVLQIGLGLLARALLLDHLVDHRDRVLGEDAPARIDHI